MPVNLLAGGEIIFENLFTVVVQWNQFRCTNKEHIIHRTIKFTIFYILLALCKYFCSDPYLDRSGWQIPRFQHQMNDNKQMDPYTKHIMAIPPQLVDHLYQHQSRNLCITMWNIVAETFFFSMRLDRKWGIKRLPLVQVMVSRGQGSDHACEGPIGLVSSRLLA